MKRPPQRWSRLFAERNWDRPNDRAAGCESQFPPGLVPRFRSVPVSCSRSAAAVGVPALPHDQRVVGRSLSLHAKPEREAVPLPDSNPGKRPIAQIDASYVLDWLRQTDAPQNIIALQERICEALGGFVSFPERARQIRVTLPDSSPGFFPFQSLVRDPQRPWECPRCHTINAWWVAHCRCTPNPKEKPCPSRTRTPVNGR